MQNHSTLILNSIIANALLSGLNTGKNSPESSNVNLTAFGEKDTVLNRMKRQIELSEIKVRCFEEIYNDNPRVGLSSSYREIPCPTLDNSKLLCQRKIHSSFKGKEGSIERTVNIPCPEENKKKGSLCVIL